MKRNRLQERNHPIHNIYANYRDAIEGLMILEDNSNPDNYFCIDKNNEIYKIYDSSEDLVKIYDYENDCIIDEISYEDLSRNQQLDIDDWEYDKDHV